MKKSVFVGAFAALATLSMTSASLAAESQVWCKAEASDGASTTVYYSSVFTADSADNAQNAEGFRAEVEAELGSAAAIETRCYAFPSEAAANAARDRAMREAPGETLSWP